ncbi:MAG TPA: 16S rRNA (guanine(966)-N(2))-methyltransferase RsmD [Clostridiales bacterium]|nr:16S rRNA (guanine(966)-N(2))-methyltransferase RsmD [Clostridiales bacterium]
MRVIAGKYKGRTLFSPKDQAVRPTTDRIKENVFNLLQGRTAGACFLDLFGGSGAMSVEALSRGARRTVTVDASAESIALVKKNFQKVGIGKEGEILFCSYDAALNRLSGEKFDLIYLDPPYRADFYEVVLQSILSCGVLAPGGLLVFEHATERALNLPEGYALFDSRKYGSVTITILTLA